MASKRTSDGNLTKFDQAFTVQNTSPLEKDEALFDLAMDLYIKSMDNINDSAEKCVSRGRSCKLRLHPATDTH